MKKRILSAFLCMCMVLTMVPAAFAVNEDSNDNSGISTQSSASLPAADANNVITLTEDVALSKMYTVASDTIVTLDLNGYTLSPAEEYSDRCLIKVSEGGNLMLTDSKSTGKITTNGKSTIRGISNNGTFTMDSGKIEVCNYAIENVVTKTSYTTNQPVICNITGGELTASYAWTVLFMGAGIAGQSSGDKYSINNGDLGSVRNDLMQVNISGNAKIVGDQALTTNASNGIYAGFTLNISGNAEISGGTNDANCAIYLPAVGNTTISGGTISGDQGIRIAAGELNITGGTIESRKESNAEDLIAGGSGGTTGAIVVGKAGGGYVGDVLVNIDEGATIRNTADGDGEDKAAIVVSDKLMNNESYNDLSITVNVNGATVIGNVVKVSNLKPGNSNDGGNTSLVLNNANVTGNVINQTKAGDLNITGGTVTGDVTNKSTGGVVIRNAKVNGTVSNSGEDGTKGKVAIINSTVAEAISDSDDDNITIIGSTIAGSTTNTENVVALIGATPYTTLQEAIKNATSGNVITLVSDIVADNIGKEPATSAIFVIPNGVTLDGNGHTIKADAANWTQHNSAGTSNHILSVEGNGTKGTLTTIKNLTIIGVNDGDKASKSGIHAYNGANVKIENVTIQNCGSVGVQINGATVEATNLDISNSGWGSINVDKGENVQTTASLNFISGNLEDNVQIYSEDKSNSTITTSLTEVNGGDGDLANKTYYTDDFSKLGEAYNKTTKTVYKDLDNALTKAASGSEIHVVKDAALDNEASVKDGVTLVIDKGVTLTGTVTNNGTIENHGTIDGIVTGNSGNMTTTVIFQTMPNNAEVVVRDDSGKVVEDSSSHTYQLTAGNYTYTVSADGYYSKSGRITVENSAITETVKLSRRSSSSGGSSSGGSTSSNRYTVSVPTDIDNGSISVSPSRAERGDTVTITVKPDEGYKLHSLIALDSDGDRITIEKERENIYTFEMPSDRVTIEATFAEIEDQPTSLPFNDVSTDDWFYDEVMYAYENGIMNGMGNNQFQPNATTNRAMVVTILYRLAGSPDLSDENLGYPFADVDASSWYGDAVYWARLNGITNGISNTNFGPDGSITREQMAALLYRYADFAGYDVSTGGMSLSEYADASDISSYAVTAMQWANENGLITGRSATTLAPKGTATRAEVATILMRFCEDVVS